MNSTAKPARRRATGPAAPEAPREKRATRRKAPAPSAGEMTIPKPSPRPATGPTGKLGVVVALMRRPEGATVSQMGEATGWQPHSVRGAMAGALKRQHKLNIVGEPGESGRVYRIAAEQPA